MTSFKNRNRFISSFLMCVFLLGIISPLAAYADIYADGEEHEIDGIDTEEAIGLSVSNETTVTVNGDVEVKSEDHTSVAVQVYEESSVTVHGDVTFDNPNAEFAVTASDGSSVTIDGNVETNTNYSVIADGADTTVTIGGNADAVVWVKDGATVEVVGDIFSGRAENGSSISVGGNADSVHASDSVAIVEGNVEYGVAAYDDAQITVKGSITDGDDAVEALNGSVTVMGTVDGQNGVKSSGPKGEAIIMNDVSAVETALYARNGGSISVNGEVSGDIGVKTEGVGSSVVVTGSVQGGVFGVLATEKNKVDITGNVSADVTGVECKESNVKVVGSVSSGDVGVELFGGEIAVTGDVDAKYTGAGVSQGSLVIKGNLSACSDDGASVGLNLVSSGTGSADVSIGGDVTSKGNKNVVGVNAFLEGDGLNIKGKVGGDVFVTATEEAALGVGIGVRQNNSAELILANGITVTGVESASGLLVESRGGNATVSVGGDISTSAAENGSGDGIEVRMWSAEKSEEPLGTVSVSVDGDVTGVTRGLYVDGRYYEDSVVTDVTIDGTLSAANGNSVVITDNVTEENFKLTVWKIELNEDGNAVVQGNGTNASTDATKAIERSINYIIKIEPAQKDVFAVNQETAKEGESVAVKVTIPDGFLLSGAYTDAGQSVELLKDDAGNYYVIMPKGGGVYLNAKLDEIRPAPPSDPEPEEPSAVTLNVTDGAIVSVDNIENAYVLNLSGRQKSMTFIRNTLLNFAKLNDILIIRTEKGVYRLSISELLNINEKAVNFRFELTESALLVYADGELVKTVSFTEFV